jgi:hypothetical protein
MHLRRCSVERNMRRVLLDSLIGVYFLIGRRHV